MNIFFESDPIFLIRKNKLNEYKVRNYFLEAISSGLLLSKTYRKKSSSYNLFHLFCMTLDYESCAIVLSLAKENNINLDCKSGNGNTPFTFLLSNFDLGHEKFLCFLELFKKYHINLEENYESISPLEVYLNYTKLPDKKIIYSLIEISDFHNKNCDETYLFYRLIHTEIFTIEYLERIIFYHKSNIKKIFEDKTSNSIWFSLYHNHKKKTINSLNWLKTNLSLDFNCEFKTDWSFYSINKGNSSKVETNVLGASIISHNKNLFNFILKEKPNLVYDKFIINNKKYSFFDFCIVSGFSPGITYYMKTISDDLFFNININKIRNTPSNLTLDKKLLIHVEKTYVSLMNKKLLILKNKTKSDYFYPKKNKI